MNNDIVNFYLDVSVNGNPTISNVLYENFDWLEKCHTWCQRAFPNYEPSEVVPGSPVLDDETLEWIKANHKEKVLELTFRYLNHFDDLLTHEYPHNNQRITRLIKFLKMLGYKDAVHVVFRMANFSRQPQHFKDVALPYWHLALQYNRETNE